MERVARGVRVFPVRTRTLPPATHTNVVVLGLTALTAVDPGSPWPEEQGALAEALEATGLPVERVLLTHHHDDHTAGTSALLADFPGARLAAHPATAAWLGLEVDEVLEDGAPLDCGGLHLAAVHTPGHAPGHLVLAAPEGVVVAGDLVAGLGTIALAPEDGDLGDYLASLERVRALAPRVLVPSHGPAVHQPEAVLSMYVAHRHQRTEQLRGALHRLGGAAPEELVQTLYGDLDEVRRGAALGEVLVHLAWMRHHGLARPGRRAAVWEVS